MRKMRLERTFWPVGHGAFYTERFNEGQVNIVYDCGSGLAPVQQVGGTAVSPPHVHNLINDFFPPHREKVKDIDILFISHLHADHINGVPALLPRVKRLVLPYFKDEMLLEALIYNAVSSNDLSFTSDSQRFILDLATGQRNILDIVTQVEESRDEHSRDNEQYPELEDVESGYDEEIELKVQDLSQKHTSGKPIFIYIEKRTPIWKYVPVNVGFDERKGKSLLNKLIRELGLNKKEIIKNKKIQWQVLTSQLSTADILKVYNIYAEVFGKIDKSSNNTCNHNAYSMPVYSGPCCYMNHYTEDVFIHMRGHCHIDCEIYGFTTKKRVPFIPCSKLLSCLYMGDFEAKSKKKLNALIAGLRVDFYRVGIQQVPHHFSGWNHNNALYQGRYVAFGNVENDAEVNKYKTIGDIESCACAPIVIRRNDNPICFDYYYL